MNAYELTHLVGGEVVRGRCRYRNEDGDWVVLATLNGDEMTYTAEGRQLAREYEVVPAKKSRTRRMSPEPVKVVAPEDDALSSGLGDG